MAWARFFEERFAIEPIPGEGEERLLRVAELFPQPSDLFCVFLEPLLEPLPSLEAGCGL